jgi:prepilin peptidase CpaA
MVSIDTMGLETSLFFLADIACVLICLYATITDLRSMRIPNRLTYSGVALGLVVNFGITAFYHGLRNGLTGGLLPSLAGCLFLFAVFALLAAIGPMGMGDVKLMAAVGAFLGWPLSVYAVAYVLIAGGVLSVGYAVARGEMRGVLRNISARGSKLLGRKKPDTEALELHKIPYAAAILAGTVWALATRFGM